jgi:biopolymer transport protein ExbD
MGGVSTDSGGKGGRKSVDSNINMVPMIDLLISVIAFLLMTAVWVQSGMLQASQPRGAPSADTPPNTDPPQQLKIVLAPDGALQVGVNAAAMQSIAVGPRKLEELRTKITEHRRAFPSQNEVWLQPDTQVKYNDIIEVMDVVYEIWGANRPPNQPIHETVTIRFL